MSLDGLAKAIADEVTALLRHDIERISAPSIQPLLLSVKEAGLYLSRSEQAVQHLIFERELPVVRVGRRVHLDRRDLDSWIEKNKY